MSPFRVSLVVTLLAIGPASSRAQAPAPSLPNLDGKLVVYVVNGAGTSTSLTDGFGTAVKHAGLPLALKTVQWCRRPNALGDISDQATQLAAAQALASEVLCLKGQCPGARVFLMGHSAGARIVLAAAESLPSCSVERIIFFAPFVGSYYDPRRALQASRLGIDSFHSPHDNIAGTVANSYGNADGTRGPSAAETGFALPFRTPDHASYQGLRQYGWNRALNISGTHFSWTQPPFQYSFILPMLMVQ